MADIVFPGTAPIGKIGPEVQPAIIDLEIYQGDDFDFELQVNNSSGAATSLAGWTGRAFFKKAFASTSAPVEATVTLVNGNMAFNVSLSSAQTSTMVGDHIYDVELTSPAGKKRTYLAGDVKVNPEVTG